MWFTYNSFKLDLFAISIWIVVNCDYHLTCALFCVILFAHSQPLISSSSSTFVRSEFELRGSTFSLQWMLHSIPDRPPPLSSQQLTLLQHFIGKYIWLSAITETNKKREMIEYGFFCLALSIADDLYLCLNTSPPALLFLMDLAAWLTDWLDEY